MVAVRTRLIGLAATLTFHALNGVFLMVAIFDTGLLIACQAELAPIQIRCRFGEIKKRLRQSVTGGCEPSPWYRRPGKEPVAQDDLRPYPEPKFALYVFWTAGRTSADQVALVLLALLRQGPSLDQA